MPGVVQNGRTRVPVYASTDGEEKSPKYPPMFRPADLVLVSKADLLPHFDLEASLRDLDAGVHGVALYAASKPRTSVPRTRSPKPVAFFPVDTASPLG